MKIHNLRKKIFKKMCLIRFFELELQKYRQNNIVKILIYLSLGQEAIAAALSIALKKPYIFMQHRGHAQYLAFGGNPKKLVDEMLGRKTGTNKGMGGSPPVFDLKKRIFVVKQYLILRKVSGKSGELQVIWIEQIYINM